MGEETISLDVVGVFQEQSDDRMVHYITFQCREKRRLWQKPRRFAIPIGEFEAWSISLGLEYGGDQPRDPNTAPGRRRLDPYALMLRLAEEMGAVVDSVCITEVHDGTFHAALRLRVGEEVRSLDARPSDAVAVAVRCKAPISVSASVVAEATPRRGDWPNK